MMPGSDAKRFFDSLPEPMACEAEKHQIRELLECANDLDDMESILNSFNYQSRLMQLELLRFRAINKGTKP